MAPSSLTLENLQSIPTKDRSVEAFVDEQRQNARYYASEPLSSINQPLASATMPPKPGPPPIQVIQTSPPLRSRLEMLHESVMETSATSSIPKKSQSKELFKSFKHAREDTMPGDSNPMVTVTKRPHSTREDEEHSARLIERRDRRRARQDIIKPKLTSPTPEESVNGDSDVEMKKKKRKRITVDDPEEDSETELTIKKKKRKGKVAPGVALMETFTASNVKKARLTLQPRDSSRLFKQARSGSVVKLGTNEKENQRIVSKSSQRSRLERKSTPKPVAPKVPKKDPKRRHVPTVSSFSDSESLSRHESEPLQAKAPKDGKKRHTKAALSVDVDMEIENEEEGNAYSDSWDIGSHLPSGDSSIEFPRSTTPRRSTKPVGIDGEPAQASPGYSEPIITTMATPWNLEGPQSALGCFTTRDTQEPAVRRKHERDEPVSSVIPDPPVQTQPRFFFSPLVAIPDYMQSAVRDAEQFGTMETGVQYTEVQEETRSPGGDFAAVAAEREEQDNATAFVRDPSPINSLDLLLREHDAAEALYGHVLIQGERHWREPSPVQPEHIYARHYSMDQLESIEDQDNIYRGDNDAGILFEYNSGEWEQQDANPLPTEQDIWQKYDQGFCREVDTERELYDPDEDTANLPQEYVVDETKWVDDVDGADEAEEEIEGFEEDVDEQADVLPFAVGRTLLMGLEDNMHSMGSRGHHTRVQRSSTYGQSVQEIEVMAARQLGHRW